MDENLRCENCGSELRRVDDQRLCRYLGRKVCSECCRICEYHRSYSGLWQCIAPRLVDPEEERISIAERILTSRRIDCNEEKRTLERMIKRGKPHMEIDNQIMKRDIAQRRYNRALREYRELVGNR